MSVDLWRLLRPCYRRDRHLFRCCSRSRPKAVSLPHLPAVIVGRGNARLVKLICPEAAALGCPFDDLAERLPGIILWATKAGLPHLPAVLAGRGRVSAAGHGG